MDKLDYGLLKSSFFLHHVEWCVKRFFWVFTWLKARRFTVPLLFHFSGGFFLCIDGQCQFFSLIHSFQVGRDGFTISHLQFVDDTICFLNNSNEQVLHLKCILQTFETISRLKVIYSKSSIMGIGVEERGGVFHILQIYWVAKWITGL